MSCPFKSLVFLDLEATDLPQFRPAITEISLIACSTEHFSSWSGVPDDILPRALHKLTVCVNPVRRVAPEAVAITGLDNFLLENERILDDHSASLIKSFLDHLQQPVCLVAHNGNGFDYPLLANSLKSFGPAIDVQCVDSLPIFRKIDADAKKLTEFIDSELTELEHEETLNLNESYFNQSCGDPSSTSLDDFAKPEERAPSPDMFAGEDIEEDMLSQLTAEAETKFLSTPNEKMIRPATSPPKLQPKTKTPRLDRTKLKPKQLFRPSYKLTTIFERCFNSIPPNAHRAEEDTLILIKCARFHAKEFLLNIPQYVKDFKSFVK